MSAYQIVSSTMEPVQSGLSRLEEPAPAPRYSPRRDTLRSLYAVFRLARRPDQVRFVFMMGDSQDNIAEAARSRAEIRDPYAANPELNGMWHERYHPERYELDQLLTLPEETLGGAYARHMKQHGLRPDFYEDVAPRHKLHFLRLRLRQTHDIWHVLTGFDTSEFGEVGLQAFYFAQVTNGQSILIGAGAMLKSIVRARFGDVEKFVAAFCDGYAKGKRAKSLLAVKWEEMWSEPTAALRARFSIEPAAPLS